jgi:hypothetical protein
MKRTFTSVLILLAGAYVVHAQGTVSFANYASSTYLYVSYRLFGSSPLLGGSTSGPTPTLENYASCVGNGNAWSIELYGAAGANDPPASLSPLGSIATFANGVNDKIAGTWRSSAVLDIPGTTLAGQIATVQLYAWYNDGGVITSFAQALEDGVPAGSSSAANVTVGGPSVSGPGSPPSELPYSALASGPQPLNPFIFSVASTVPEPTTIALGLMGAAAFLLRLRR